MFPPIYATKTATASAWRVLSSAPDDEHLAFLVELSQRIPVGHAWADDDANRMLWISQACGGIAIEIVRRRFPQAVVLGPRSF